VAHTAKTDVITQLTGEAIMIMILMMKQNDGIKWQPAR
jgi:hypothetical protein